MPGSQSGVPGPEFGRVGRSWGDRECPYGRADFEFSRRHDWGRLRQWWGGGCYRPVDDGPRNLVWDILVEVHHDPGLLEYDRDSERCMPRWRRTAGVSEL